MPSLIEWYEANGRHALPWRATRDRWSLLVAEVMLQQTQVGRVEQVWDSFLARFPDPQRAAAAGPGALIAAWGRLAPRAAEAECRRIGGRLGGRDRLLALMDLGALVCTPRAPRCPACPLRRSCATRGVLAGERRSRQPPYAGSFRERRGRVLAALRVAPTAVAHLDAEALASLVTDGLAVVYGATAELPR